MSDEAERGRDRLAAVTFDETTIPLGQIDRDHERAAAVFDLIEDNRFSVRGRDDGPYSLRLARSESRLRFEVRDSAGAPVVEFAVSMTPFQSLLKDYFRVCETYFSAIRGAGARQIADIDLPDAGTGGIGSHVAPPLCKPTRTRCTFISKLNNKPRPLLLNK